VVLRLLASWCDPGDEQEQRETLEYLKRVLDEDRPSSRKFFHPTDPIDLSDGSLVSSGRRGGPCGSEIALTIILSFPPDTERGLRELAAASGQTVEGFVHDLVEREVVAAAAGDRAAPVPSSSRPVEEVFAPLRREFEESGMSEEDLVGFLTEIRDEARREKRARKAQ
jgi:hypothetical protein